MPPADSIKSALRHLTILGALNVKDRSNLEKLLQLKTHSLLSDPTTINPLGQLLSKIPISPKFGKMLIVAQKYDVLDFAIMMVACMSVNELFTEIKPVM